MIHIRTNMGNGKRVAAATLAVAAATLGLAVPGSARLGRSGLKPSGRLARALNVNDTAKLHLTSTSGSLLNEQGSATGTLPGVVKTSFRFAARVSASIVIYPHGGGSITIHGSGLLHSSGVFASYGGSMSVTGATGRYAHAHGSGGFYGVVNRRTWAITAQTTGKLSY